jgi:hypothetical protein
MVNGRNQNKSMKVVVLLDINILVPFTRLNRGMNWISNTDSVLGKEKFILITVKK